VTRENQIGRRRGKGNARTSSFRRTHSDFYFSEGKKSENEKKGKKNGAIGKVEGWMTKLTVPGGKVLTYHYHSVRALWAGGQGLGEKERGPGLASANRERTHIRIATNL